VPAVIFTIAFDQYALQSFEYNTIDYLLKPISPERLEKAVLKAEGQLRTVPKPDQREKPQENDRIFVKDGKKCWFITLANIRLFESKGNYTQIFFDDNSPLILKTLQHIEDSLDAQQFVRVNRGQIINIKFIKNVVKWFDGRLKITLTRGGEIEVSRRQMNRIREIFSI